MAVKLGDVFPQFTADCTDGKFVCHDRIGNGKWSILFSHPADFTPVCTTELGRVVNLMDKFKERNCQVFALSCDGVQSHKDWSKDVMDYASKHPESGAAQKQTKAGVGDLPFPIIADPKREIAEKLGMIDPDERDGAGIPLTCRAVFIIGPDKKLKLSFLYPATTGRNFDEILRVLDSLQLTATKKVATPENWKGGECMVLPTVSEDEAKKIFPAHKVMEVPSGKKYLRFTPCPNK